MPYYKSIKSIRDEEERLRITDKLLILRSQLDKQIPQKTATDTLLLATWNIREFGANRRTESYHYIAEIINRFDLIAIQEVAKNLKGLEKVVSLLNLNWDYIVTDSTAGTAGGSERMAFIFDKNKVSFKKMAGKIGDFNIPNCQTDYMKALEKKGFTVPAAIKEHPTDLGGTYHYDQIAFNLKLDPTMTVFSEKEQKAGAFNFTESIYTLKDIAVYRKYFDAKSTERKTDKEVESYYLSKYRTFQMSDHLPLWVELKIDFSNQYLAKIGEKK
jgi:exonuclease III